jgi:hypothetical protein
MIKEYIYGGKNVVMIYYKMQIYCKMIQMIPKLDEIFSHILNMNWLYHFNYNWKVWLLWFHKKHLNKFFIQMNISVLKKNILLKDYFHLKDDKNCCKSLYQNPFYTFIKMLDEIKEKLHPNYTPKKYIFLLKVAPP